MARKKLFFAGLFASCAIAAMIAVWAKSHTLAIYTTPEAIAEWQAWRDQAAEQNEQGVVYRRVPKSPEPPALVLMRDYFPAVISSAILAAGLTYAFGVFSYYLLTNSFVPTDLPVEGETR